MHRDSVPRKGGILARGLSVCRNGRLESRADAGLLHMSK